VAISKSEMHDKYNRAEDEPKKMAATKGKKCIVHAIWLYHMNYFNSEDKTLEEKDAPLNELPSSPFSMSYIQEIEEYKRQSASHIYGLT